MSIEVTIVAGGPSLRTFDWSSLTGDIIAINNAAFMLPQAKYCYFANKDWFDLWWPELFDHPGKKIQGWDGTEAQRVSSPWVEKWRFIASRGLTLEPRCLCNGINSGYAAINLAVQLGYKRIRLLGYDMHSPGQNFHDDHVWTAHDPEAWLAMFETIVEPLKELGVEVVNLTPGSALKCFPTATL